MSDPVGGEVVYPDNSSVLLTFLKLEGGELNNEVRGLETGLPLETRLGLLLSKEQLICLPKHCYLVTGVAEGGNVDYCAR